MALGVSAWQRADGGVIKEGLKKRLEDFPPTFLELLLLLSLFLIFKWPSEPLDLAIL